ncbi:hypothetical protein Tco_0748317 [Tanacetum coccineum]|uniref:Uncharacterized protein n=1 Tax=Tanacetum coccineum TaxID=301880 RepID=A0ABQ4YWH2_9ASTR
MIATTITTPTITSTTTTTRITITITTATMITISSKMEGRKSLRLMETIDIMDLITFVGSVHYITQDCALLDVRIATKLRDVAVYYHFAISTFLVKIVLKSTTFILEYLLQLPIRLASATILPKWGCYTTAMPNVGIPQGIDTGGSPRHQETMGVLLPRLGGYTLGTDKGRMKLDELITLCTKLSKQVLDLEKEKDAQAVEILNLKKRIRRMHLKQGRRSDKIKPMFTDKDFEELDDHMENVEEETIDAATTRVSTAEPRTPPTSTTVFNDEDVTMEMA